MKEFSACERALHKVDEMTRPILAPIRRKELNNIDFTIISNNCWGGVCYEYYGLPKQSPTVGMYFFADEYIRFLSNLKHYMSKSIFMISATESRYAEELLRRGQNDILIGVLDDVEMVMLHYKDKEIAKDKWNRRVERVNWNNMIYKFSYMNGCKDDHICEFEMLMQLRIQEGVKKGENIRSICFSTRQYKQFNDTYVVPFNSETGQIDNDTFYWNRYCDVPKIINAVKS